MQNFLLLSVLNLDSPPFLCQYQVSALASDLAFSQMSVQASCGWALIEENHFVFHMLPYEFFI